MKKKVAVVTGVSKGIGKSIGEKFENESITVVGFSRSEPRGKCTHWVQGDVTKKEDRDRLKKEVMENYGSIDILVNNAGQGIVEKWEDTPESEIRSVLELNFFSVVELTKLFLPELKKSKGTIINASSVLGKASTPYMGAYCSAKSAIDAFSDTLRMELKHQNVHVLNLTIGSQDTAFPENCLGSHAIPAMPILGNPDVLATKTYKAYVKRQKEITYPGWYVFYIGFARHCKTIYESINIKSWKLDKDNG